MKKTDVVAVVYETRCFRSW